MPSGTPIGHRLRNSIAFCLPQNEHLMLAGLSYSCVTPTGVRPPNREHIHRRYYACPGGVACAR